MNEIKMGGKTFLYEKVMPEQFNKGACAFHVKDADGDESWWVVVPPTLKAQIEGVVIDSPEDGHVAAFCMNRQDALMIASSICISAGMARSIPSIVKDVKEGIGRKAKELAATFNFDIDALGAEVKRLKDEGKSMKEVEEILKPRMEEFIKKPAADKGGEW